MTFTYTLGATTDLNRVREMLGDVDSTDPLLADEVIAPVIVNNPMLTRAAAACCTLIMGRLARRAVDKRMGATSLSNSQLMENYVALRAQLLADGGDETPGGQPNLSPIAGGISIAENQRIEGDTDFIRQSIGTGQDDFHGNALPAPTTQPWPNPNNDDEPW